LDEIVIDGVLGVRQLRVLSNKTRGRLLPPRLLVRDLMTSDPVRVREDEPLNKILAVLLSSTFTGMPVVDEENRVTGVLSQTDLIYRAGMPLRLALMACAREKIEQVEQKLARRLAKDAMSAPPVCIEENAPVAEAVSAMIEKGVKRLPVLNDSGRLTGIVSRIDIFRAVTRESSRREKLREQNIVFENIRLVSDIMERDVATVFPEETVEDVIRVIHTDAVERVWVVDRDERLLGMISDRNLLAAFREDHPGIWELLGRMIPSGEKRAKTTDFGMKLRRKTAGEIMKTDIVTAGEGTPVEAAVEIMTKNGFRRLPVVGEDGKLKGVVSRETLLKKGFEIV
jgi:CBS domain-containing protein